MENTFKTIINNLDQNEILMLGNQTFLNEIISNQHLRCSRLGKIIFFEVDFEKIDFTENTFINCEFRN